MTQLHVQGLCSNTTAVTGTVVPGVFQTTRMKLSATTKLEKIALLQQWNEQEQEKLKSEDQKT